MIKSLYRERKIVLGHISCTRNRWQNFLPPRSQTSVCI